MPGKGQMSIEQRLIEGSEVVETGCRRWRGSHSPKGYGQINVGGKTMRVHRVAYEVWVGPIPVGTEIDHVHANGCRYRDCIEPSHLEAVSHLENLRRRRNAVPPTHCPKGHEFTPENTRYQSRKDRSNPARRCRQCHMDYMCARRKEEGEQQ
jgi:hypothetical protein